MQGTRLLGGPQGPVVASAPLKLTPTPRSDAYLEAVFGPGGYLAQASSGYTERAGQRAIAKAVHDTFEQSVPCLAEGPCGTGKGIGYGVPAVYWAARTRSRVVIATATNALLQQLLRNDLPLLAKALPWKFTFSGLMGRRNYLCAAKAAGFIPSLLHPNQIVAAKALARFAKTTTTGNKDDAPPETHEIWHHVSVGPEECKKPRCNVEEFCHAEIARKVAAKSEVLVTNMHMVALHLQTGRVLPEFDFLILDEGHEFADICREFFGDSVSPRTAKSLLSSCEHAGVHTGPLHERFDLFFDGCKKLLEHPLDAVFAPDPKAQDGARESHERRVLAINALPAATLEPLAAGLEAAHKACAAVIDADTAFRKEHGYSIADDDEVAAARTGTRLAGKFNRVLFPPVENQVRWLESAGKSVTINVQPVTVGPSLRSLLFERYPRTVITSATLSTAGTFGFIRSEIGFPKEGTQLAVESPFNFEQQAMLIVPRLPAPDVDPEGWSRGVLETIEYVVRVLDGRTMSLHTSVARMREAHAYVERGPAGERQLLLQGKGSTRALVDAFKKDERSVLFGTNTCWTGIDAPGDTLSALIIDRLPMLTSSPQLDAIKSAMRAEKWTDEKGVEHTGRDFFSSYYTPKSALRLRQGFGRAIRSRQDVAVVVCCDSRLLDRPYGAAFMRSLPKLEGVSRSLEDLVPFMRFAREKVRGAK